MPKSPEIRTPVDLGACRTYPARLRKTIFWLEFSDIFVSYDLIASKNPEKFHLKSRFPRLHASSPTGSKVFVGEAVCDVVDDFGFLVREKRLVIATGREDTLGFGSWRGLRMGIMGARRGMGSMFPIKPRIFILPMAFHSSARIPVNISVAWGS